ncbi:serine hydrolase domain-containing protein [Kitasatospora sp. NPDC056181]|uniref:serine hydrolase domain-containing protein n=1 Tax=Kitasatospora sp. NPDC056181 TaxID=3345737 RepID=UPI0035E05047
MNRKSAALAALIAAAVLVPAAAPAVAAPLGGSAVAQGRPADRAADRAALQQALDAAVAGGAPGAIAEIRDERGTWQGVSGYADLAGRQRPQASDRFRAGSVTKSFTSTVVLQLVAEGRIGLDDPIERHLPGLLPNGDHITVRRLLNHTAGLTDFIELLLADPGAVQAAQHTTYTPEQLIGLAVQHGPKFAPGTSWGYSNTNYFVLGLLVEHTTGRSLSQEITRRILHPLHLRNTSLPGSDRLPGPQLHGYEWLAGPGAAPVDLTAFNPSVYWAAGGIVSTTSDLNRFYRALFGGELLPPEQLRAMQEMQQTDRDDHRTYGLGLEARPACADGSRVVGHTGSVAGYTTFSFTSKDGRRQLTLAVNASVTLPAAAGDAMTRLVTTALCDR